MNRFKLVLWALAIFALGSLFMAVFLIHPAFAAQCTSYDATVAAIRAHGHEPFFIAPAKLPKTVADAEELTGETYGTASRGFLLVGPDKIALGLEVGGCLLDPIIIAKPKADGAA